jgi:hypothetical protein
MPNYSALGKRNPFGNVTSALRLREIARVLVYLDHVARVIRKRESRHHVSDCETSRNQLRC